MSWLSSLKSVFTPAQEVKQEDVQQVLQAFTMQHNGEQLQDRIT